jgi:hypothetical protein
VKREPAPRRLLLQLAVLAVLGLASAWPLMAVKKWTARQSTFLRLAHQSTGDLAELTCDRPATVNHSLLEKWGCKVLRDSCLDQVTQLQDNPRISRWPFMARLLSIEPSAIFALWFWQGAPGRQQFS